METVLTGSNKGFCFLIKAGGLWAILLFPLVASAFAQPLPQQILQENDCVKCHAFTLKLLQNWGGKHATEVGCLDCHPQHPPEKENTKLACKVCHTEHPHFEIDGCLDCHNDPHKPLAFLPDPIKPARMECLTCHGEIGQQMSASPSRHAKLFCTRCHSRHGFIPGCLDCHGPHLSSQVVADCLRCHAAHQPLKIIPSGWVQAEYCQVCHHKEGKNLANTKTNHGGINCVYCHEGSHPSTPSCQKCHGLPHDQLLHSQFRRCLSDCHGDAHELLSHR